MIYYCCPTLNQHHNLYKWAEAAMQGTVKPDKILIVDNSGRYLAEDIDFGDYPVEILSQDENLGCGPSWNLCLSEAYGTIIEELKMSNYELSPYIQDYCIIANDDVFVHPQTIEHLVSAAQQDTNNVFFHGSGHSGNSFSLFLLTAKGYVDIGLFDEFIWPAYFEDNDYHRRLKRKGLDIIGINEATFDHIGSATVKKFDETQARVQNVRFERNRMYYMLKWGGVPHQELFEKPWNGRKEEEVQNYIRSVYGY